MKNMNEFVNYINNLKKEKKFKEILVFFKKEKNNFTNKEISRHNLLISIIITSLRKTNNLNSILKFMKIYNISLNDDTHDMVLNAYGWLMYDKYKIDSIKANFDKFNFLTLINDVIILICKKKSEFSYTIISRFLNIVFKTEKEKLNVDWNFINKFCNIFDPNHLSLECDVIEIRGKKKELASDKESWYQHNTKALFELENYEECYNISKIALENIENFHFSNDVWFARRIALSKKELGNLDEAIKDLEEIYKDKNEWFIQKELADMYFEIDNIDKAFEYSIQAINKYGKIEYKIGLILLLARILKIQNKITLSYKHFLAVKLIREENDWKISDELEEEINSVKVDGTYDDIMVELKKYWKSFILESNKDFFKGRIKKILNDNDRGKNGWITSEGKDYYFTIPSHISITNNIFEKTNIKFVVIDAKDGRVKAKIISII